MGSKSASKKIMIDAKVPVRREREREREGGGQVLNCVCRVGGAWLSRS